MNQQEKYKNALRIFSLLVVVLGVYQTYKFETAELLNRPTNNSTDTSQTPDPNTTILNASSSYTQGIHIFATTQAEPFVKQSLTRRDLSPIVKSYTLTGVEWAFNAALTYGHFVVAMYIYSAFKNPENPRAKKVKIVGFGLVILFAWIYLAPRIGYEKIKVVDKNGAVLYHTEKGDEKHKFEVFLNDNSKLFELKNEQDLAISSEDGRIPESQNGKSSVDSGQQYRETRDDDVQQIVLPREDL